MCGQAALCLKLFCFTFITSDQNETRQRITQDVVDLTFVMQFVIIGREVVWFKVKYINNYGMSL